MRILLTLPRHDSCTSACLVESGTLFSLIFFPFYNITWVRSCLRALAFVFLFDFYHLRVFGVYLIVNFFVTFFCPSFFPRATSLLASACSSAGLSLQPPSLLESVV